MTSLATKPLRSRAFTLVELAVAVLITGVLATFAVPRFMNSVERSKATEAFTYLSTIHSAQERYHARQGTYAADLADLDTSMRPLQHFMVGIIDSGMEPSLETGWELTLTRFGAPSGYGAYTVAFNQDGYDEVGSNIPDEVNPLQTP